MRSRRSVSPAPSSTACARAEALSLHEFGARQRRQQDRQLQRPLQRASKAALNSLSRSFAASLAGKRVTVLAIAPGWVRTDMGGPHATLGVEESVRGIVDVLERRAGSGKHAFVDYRGRDVAW